MRLAFAASRSPRGFALLLCLSLAGPLLASCGSSGGGTGTGPVGNVVIHDADNFTSKSTLMIPVVPTAAGVDLSISWPGITQDLLCHPATSIDNVSFLRIGNMSQDDVQKKLAIGKLVASEVTTYREFHTGASADGGAPATSTMLSNLKYGSALVPATDYVEAPSTQYLLLFTHGTTIGVGAQAMVFIQPSASETNVDVAAPDACASKVLTFMAMLSSTPVSIPTAGPWKIDWSQITKDSFGNALDFSMTKLDLLEVGFYQGKTAADLQTNFLDVEITATAIYSVAVPNGQKYVDLAGALTTGGTAFPGFTQTDGTWAAAVRCSTCSVPAPVVFVILQPQ